MKNIITYCVLVFSFATQAIAIDQPRIYQSAQGNIDITKMESILSLRFNSERSGQRVVVENIRWSRNPFDYGEYFLSKILDEGPFATYVMNVRIEDFGTDTVLGKAKCDFVVAATANKAFVLYCTSNDVENVKQLLEATGTLEHFGFSK